MNSLRDRVPVVLSCCTVCAVLFTTCVFLGIGVDDVYVSAAAGDDAGWGSRDSPVATIDRALEIAGPQSGIVLLEGVYDAAGGTTFPVVLGDRLTLRAEPDHAVTIRGAGTFRVDELASDITACVVVTGENTVCGVAVEAPGGIAVFVDDGAEATIDACSATDSDYGVVVLSEESVTLNRNTIQGNTQSGVNTIGSSAPRIRNTTVTGNDVGVLVGGTSQPDLGTAELGGSNSITGNVSCDCYNTTTNAVAAIGNAWDTDVTALAVVGSCTGGADLVSPAGSIQYAYVPATDTPLFDGTSPIELGSPAEGATLATTTPTLRWTATQRPLVAAGVFSSPIVVRNGQIDNPDDLVWLWHSGLPTGDEGSVPFDAGRGDFEANDAPQPLTRGRTYYWACWAWDDSGSVVSRSSAQYTFFVSN